MVPEARATNYQIKRHWWLTRRWKVQVPSPIIGFLYAFSGIAVPFPDNMVSLYEIWGCKHCPARASGLIAKNGFLGQKPYFLAQKLNSLPDGYHVLATTRQSYAKKKVSFPKLISVFLRILGVVFWGGKRIFGPFPLFGKTLKRTFLHNTGREQVRCRCGSFFGGRDSPTKFGWTRSYLGKFFRDENFFGGTLGCIDDMPVWREIAIPKQKMAFYPKYQNCTFRS